MATKVDNIDEVKHGLVQYAETAIGHLVRRGTTPDEAKEIVQQACVNALEKRDQYQTNTNFRKWFFSIIFSRRNDFFRLKTRESTRKTNFETPEDIADAIGIDWDEIADDDRMVALRKCLQQENPFQQAVQLRYIDKLKHKEIAVRLDIPEKTASTRIHRGIRKLKDCIEGSLKL